MSSLRPIEAHHVKKGSMVMLKGHPCKIMDVKTSKTGKHGHAKCNITGIDVLTSKKYNEVHPGHIILSEFDLKKDEYELTNLDEKDNTVSVMDDKTAALISFQLDLEHEVTPKLLEAWKGSQTAGAERVIIVTVVTAPEGETEPKDRSVIESFKYES